MECDVKPNENSNLPQTIACDLQQRNMFSLKSLFLRPEPKWSRCSTTCNKEVGCDS